MFLGTRDEPNHSDDTMPKGETKTRTPVHQQSNKEFTGGIKTVHSVCEAILPENVNIANHLLY